MLARLSAPAIALLALAAVAMAAAPTGALDWKPAGDGIETAETTLEAAGDGATEAVPVFVVRIDPAKVRLRVVDPVRAVQQAGRASGAYSLRELLGLGAPRAVINGGFTGSFTYPLPTGLVRHDRQTLSPLNRASKTQSGIFCVRDGKPSILPKSEYTSDRCDEALQSGPRVVEAGGTNGIHPSERQGPRHQRSLVAIDHAGRLLLVRSGPATLYDLAELLRRKPDAGGLGCRTALNLSGDAESGLAVRDAQGALELRGEVDVTIASAIGVFAKGLEELARHE